MLNYNRNNLYKITIRFIRRVGRSTPSLSFFPKYDIAGTNGGGTATTSAWTNTIAATSMAPDADQEHGTHFATGTSELPWYSQNANFITPSYDMYHDIRGVILVIKFLEVPRLLGKDVLHDCLRR